MSVPDALEHLVGLQAQTVNTWYTGLWSRLRDFDPLEASQLLEQREIVRIALMRSTIHLVTARDAVGLRPVLQPAVARPMSGRRRPLAEHADEITAEGRRLLAAGPLNNRDLAAELAKRWPQFTPDDLPMAVRVGVPLVQVTPRGTWNASGDAAHSPLDQWLAGGTDAARDALDTPCVILDELVLRYLGAFGPATPADAQNWSRLSRLREVFERLRPQLVTFTAEDGRELFDLPDAPRPGAETAAPARLLYDFDNLLLGHADRSRFAFDEWHPWMISVTQRFAHGSLLVDGLVVGVWRLERGKTARVIIKPAGRLPKADRDAAAGEAESLLDMWAPESVHEVSFA